jgi:uncharacterized iron-regulated membrane protein
MTRGRLAAGLVTFLLAAGMAGAGTRWPPPYPYLMAQQAHPQGGGISLDEAVSRVRRQTGGKILSAETSRVDGRRVHRIKVLTEQGRVQRLQVDARSGQVTQRGH